MTSEETPTVDEIEVCEGDGTGSPIPSLDVLPGGRLTENSSVDTQARLLLKALENFVVPLATDATSDAQKEDRAGNELISALRRLITVIIRGSSHEIEGQESSQNEILSEDDDDVFSVTDSEDSLVSAEDFRKAVDMPKSSFTRTGIRDFDQDQEGDWEPFEEQKAFTKLQWAMQKHIFNTMPIRLLHFESSGSKPQITLMERAEIYDMIAPRLETHKEIFFSDIRRKSLGATNTTLITQKHVDEVVENWVVYFTRYAILSHTWIRTRPGEVTYADWHKDRKCLPDAKPEGYRKLYRNADVCITHLAKTAILSDMASDPWFSRGWTLQELLAPGYLKFYDATWKTLAEEPYSDKFNPIVSAQIENATQITPDELSYKSLHEVPISRRMRWAAMRQVTREEDTAYSLMGIFHVSISIAYGEGAQKAFRRLITEIMNTFPNVMDIFNWAGTREIDSSPSSLFPSSPSSYLSSAQDLTLSTRFPIKPFTLTHLGLRVPMLVIPAISPANAALDYTPFGDYYATVDVFWASDHERLPYSYNLLDKKIFDQEGFALSEVRFQMMFGILNFDGMYTEKPIVFELKSNNNPQRLDSSLVANRGQFIVVAPENDEYYCLQRNELIDQKMKISVYNLKVV
ncbi:hypothetical protein BDN70DRAFT_924037 [Pholiota conissans]|uniref:Heterokaryon incompatibility domain-containing protein n=1 Tax=Pholiota conissans TaxID=109636 RepID=A0A9P6CW58_9AGAR|nr:hypothetical protein BDN70DRAFT_924037 [Pholiota conissans]